MPKAGTLYWVGNSWNIRTQILLASALEDYFTESMTREQLAARFARAFAGLTDRGRAYWEMLADHTATKTREMGRVTGYKRAGIARVQLRARLDERTTPVCRQMHGRIIPVARMRAQRDAYLAAVASRNEPAARAAWEMHGANADLSGAPTVDLKGTASPPYHFRCRTITVAWFGPPAGDTVADLRQRVTDREPAREGDLALGRDRAARAGFMGEKTARAKFTRHRANIPARRLRDYEADARALIADPDAQVLLSARVPSRNEADAPGQVALHAVFARPQASRTRGEPGYLVTVVDLEENTILSHHWREGISSDMDITAAQPVTKRKGIWSWLTS